MELGQVIKRVPGFRSGSKIKAGIASVFYLLAIFFILLIVIPPPETEKSQIEEQAATPTEGILESETEEEREGVWLLGLSKVAYKNLLKNKKG